MLLWICWKCKGVLHRMPGTFEAPIGNWDLAWTMIDCKHCGAVNHLTPPAMKASIQEVGDLQPQPDQKS